MLPVYLRDELSKVDLDLNASGNRFFLVNLVIHFIGLSLFLPLHVLFRQN